MEEAGRSYIDNHSRLSSSSTAFRTCEASRHKATMLAVSKCILLATLLIPLAVRLALAATDFRAGQSDLGCKGVQMSAGAVACTFNAETDSLITMHVVVVPDLHVHLHVDEMSANDMLREAGTIAHQLVRGGMAIIAISNIALSIMCDQPQDSGQVMLCNMMQLAFEAIKDEFVAALRPSIVHVAETRLW